MTTPPPLFDAALLARRRARAAGGGERADFLHEAVAAEISDRLAGVNRSFRSAALVGPRFGIWETALAGNTIDAIRSVPDAETLDLEPEAHDLVIHALALQWANDPVGQLVQARRALAPDGLLLAALFGGETLHELRDALAAAEVETTGGLSPRVAPMGEIRDLGGLLQRAGLALPVADSRRFDVSYRHPLALMRDLRAMGETNVMHARRRTPLRRDTLEAACRVYAERHASADGRVAATFEVIFLTGWAPSAGQPKPLRAGSAAARLAEALGAVECGAGEKAGR
jgi:SAM-dependent methyltransferase